MMGFIFHPSRRRVAIAQKDVLIKVSQKKFHDRVQNDVAQIEKINKVLGNGITLNIGRAIGADHR